MGTTYKKENAKKERWNKIDVTTSVLIIGVARGGGGRGARAPSEFGRPVNPIRTRGGRGRFCPSYYFQHPAPRFKKNNYTSVNVTTDCDFWDANIQQLQYIQSNLNLRIFILQDLPE